MIRAQMFGSFVASVILAMTATHRQLCAAEPAPTYVKDSTGATPKPAIAIPDVCAFPFITQFGDGTIVGIIFNQPSHGRLPGDVSFIATTDGGATWQKRGPAVAHEPGTMTTRMNKAFGLLPNGQMLVICAGWTLINKPNELGDLDVDKQLPPVQTRSSDGGKTWTLENDAFPKQAPSGHTHTPWGLIQVGADGALRAVSYEFDKVSKWRTVRIWRSADEGKTWGDPVMLDAKQNLNETSLLHLGGGKWIAVSRDSGLTLYRSNDDAATWSRVGPVTEAAAIPGTLLKLADGRILLSNGNRTKDDEHCEVRISNDNGATFSPPIRLVDFITFDGGYPCSVQRADGMIVTVYYARKTKYHDGYHMGVVIWDPVATFGKPGSS